MATFSTQDISPSGIDYFQVKILDRVCEHDFALEILVNVHRQSEKEFFTHQSSYVKRRTALESVEIIADAALRCLPIIERNRATGDQNVFALCTMYYVLAMVTSRFSFIGVCWEYVSYLLMVKEFDDVTAELEEVKGQVDTMRQLSELLREDTKWMDNATEAVETAYKKRK